MIYLEVQGNLGNQLFQYAFARKLQEETGQKICLNLANFNKGRPDLKFTLCNFKLNKNICIEKNKKMPFYANSYSLFARVVKKICPVLYAKGMIRVGVLMWQQRPFIGEMPRGKKNYYISGWFQNPKYFQDIKYILKQEIVPREEPPKANECLYQEIVNSESVCVSIRRGDYVSNEKFNKIYFMCDESYYTKAMEEIKQRVKNPVFVFFSDDIEWVRKNIKVEGKALYETGNDSVEEKIRLMSACKHYIISNSSFSWWCQFLGSDSESIIVSPKKWTHNETVASPLIQDDWIHL